ncbi:MAG: endonuclease MutS2 [Tissierellia bacterium]|nr:endonuclease MutS2 [Tissierellia bacterium]
MNKSGVRVLEFEKIKQALMERMPSPGSRAQIEKQDFAKSPEELMDRQKALREALGYLLAYSPLPFGPLKDMRHELGFAKRGGVLDPLSLLDIGDSLRSITRMKSFLEKHNERQSSFRILYNYGAILLNFNHLQELIENTVDYDGTIKSTASKTLAGIRRSIQSKEEEIRRKIDSFLNDKRMEGYLQESLVTMRNDRYVLPVKSEHKRRVEGLVHDRSSSGSTLYIEPIALVNLNNDLRELRSDEQEEIHKILKEISGRLGEEDAIAPAYVATEELYRLFGLARYALEHDSHLAKTGEHILLKRARHPLLDEKTVVPLDLEFGEDARILIITGPNTGGKTVALKTLGLLSLMHQFGMAVPCDDGSVLPFFDDIYVDIGDEQSIEQSLSTFSSHMVNLISILEKAGPQSLVLLDELGAGTDPQEGSALAKSMLMEFEEKGSMVFATSHYSEIKNFAFKRPGYMNSSVEFDARTLSPTFRLLMGVPGSSNALYISQRLGLPERIVDRARSSMDDKGIAMEEMLAEIEKKRIHHEELEKKARMSLEEAKKLEAKYEEKLRIQLEQKDKELLKAKQEAAKLLKNTEEEAREIMKNLRSMKGNVDFSEMEKQSQRLGQLKGNLQQKAEIRPIKAPKALKVGERIFIPHLNTQGEVLEKPNQKGDFRAQVGIMRLSLNLSQVEKSKVSEKERIQKQVQAFIPSDIKTTLDLRGMNSEDARVELGKFIDQALLSNPPQLEIIHGKGTGVLREFVKDYLKKSPFVKSFREGGHHEGGSGVTLIKLH